MNLSSDYATAYQIIDILAANPVLAPLLFGQNPDAADPRLRNGCVFDADDQVGQLALAAQSAGGCLTISPAESSLPYDRNPGGILNRLDTQVHLIFWTITNLTQLPDGMASGGEYRAAIIAEAVATIQRAVATSFNINFCDPAILSIGNFTATDKRIPDISARCATLAIIINHQPNTNQPWQQPKK